MGIGRIIAAVIALCSGTAFAQTSQVYASYGRATWAAFVCTTLAANFDQKEASRLFDFGYSRGQQFISALKAQKITKDDISKSVPVVVLMMLEGPTPDFMLGRIFENAQREAMKDIYKDLPPQDVVKLATRTKYDEANCSLVGR